MAPPTWKVPPSLLFTKLPPPVNVSSVVAPAATLAPIVTAPVTVRVLPVPMRTWLVAVVLFVCARREAMVWLNAPRSSTPAVVPVPILTAVSAGRKFSPAMRRIPASTWVWPV